MDKSSNINRQIPLVVRIDVLEPEASANEPIELGLLFPRSLSLTVTTL